MKLIGFPLLALGVLLAIYGVFALAFNEEGSATQVTLIGHRLTLTTLARQPFDRAGSDHRRDRTEAPAPPVHP